MIFLIKLLNLYLLYSHGLIMYMFAKSGLYDVEGSGVVRVWSDAETSHFLSTL